MRFIMLFNTAKKFFDRYEWDGKEYVISISTNHFRDLFNKFDRTSSFIKRDLDYDFAEYLYESAIDLAGKPFYIRLDLHQEKRSDNLEKKVYQGIDSYFEYEVQKIDRQMGRVIWKIIIHSVIAIGCFFISYILNKYIKTSAFYYILFVESIVIAAWVFMWPVFSDFIYKLLNTRKTRKIYNLLIDAPIVFNYISEKK